MAFNQICKYSWLFKIDDIMEDSIAIIDNTVSNMPSMNDSVSIWFWIALVEFILLVLLLLKMQRPKREKLDLSEVKKTDLKNSENIDMYNLLDSIHHSKELYKALSKKCHPDKFVNTPLHQIAEEIFQEITRNKRNYKQLIALKAEAINKLDLKF